MKKDLDLNDDIQIANMMAVFRLEMKNKLPSHMAGSVPIHRMRTGAMSLLELIKHAYI